MKYSAFSIATLILSLPSVSRAGNSINAGEKPNIVLIVADDLGYGDLGCYGSKSIRTPNIDRLATQGVRFTRFYTNAPECTPTRTALLTGRYQQRVPGLECAIGAGNIGRYEEAKSLSDRHELGLSPAKTVLPSKLKEAGYISALFGKWHLGYEQQFRPLQHGFDFALGPIGYGGDYFHHLEEVDSLRINDFHGNFTLSRNDRQDSREGYYYTYLFTDEAIAWLNQRKDNRPFFLYMPYTAPHTPYQAPDDFKEIPVKPADWNTGTRETYIKMVECLDQQVGRILDKLEEQSLKQNTIVVFISDNGPTRLGETGGFRGNKGQLFDGGIHVPCIIRWPGKIKPGMVSDQVTIGMDLTKSIINAAHIPGDMSLKLDGIDIIKRIVQNQPDTVRTLFWRARRGINIQKSVRSGDWKLIEVSTAGKTEKYLFNLSDDPYEKTNLFPEQTKKSKVLEAELADWEKDVDINRK